MKQNELLAASLIGIFAAILGWVVVTNFIAKPEDMVEEIRIVRPFDAEFNKEAIQYLKDDSTKVYTVDIDVKESIGTGNDTPFTGQ